MDSKMKQRLVGAIVLIALAVIFLPMLIKGPAPDSGVSDVSLRTPDAPDSQFVEIPLNTVGDVPEGGVVGLNPTGAPATPAPAVATPADSTVIPAADVNPAAVASGDYAVNFGAYATAADANQVVAMLKKAQLPGFSEPATVNGRQAYRVRIGPYADRAQAEIVRLESLKVRGDVKAQVVALNAQPAAPAPIVTTQPLPPEPKPEPSPVETKPVAAAPKPAEPKPVVAAPKPAETKPATPAPKPVAAAPKPAQVKPADPAPKPATPKPAATGFAVQVGAFADASQANALRDQLRAKGLSAFVEKVNSDNGVLNRVRVGPVATREAADALRAKVGSGQVRPHP